MKKFFIVFFSIFFSFIFVNAQKLPKVLQVRNTHRCATMEQMEAAIKNNPSLPEQWAKEGMRKYNLYLQRQSLLKETETPNEIIIPVVFHIVDEAARQAWVTDRDIYEQVEILNRNFNGKKAMLYKDVIPSGIYNRLGSIPVKFVLARRSPTGTLTSGIERRVNGSPDHIAIKSFATGGLDAWDVSKYVNIWAGTFSGDEEGLLGIATFPFTSDQGAQGVVIATATIPYASNVSRSYYPAYAEGSTLTHELGHFFYLWHTFGDDNSCNNNDFRIQAGWPLPNGAGPEGDDTPAQKGDNANNADFGNPSRNYTDGCAPLQLGEMYGSFMNYFDDRALFMFSEGHQKRVEGCIDLYRPGLKNSNGAVPPVSVTDAYLVTLTPRGTPERRAYILNNTPITATIRNNGTSVLQSISLHLKWDVNVVSSQAFSLNLPAGNDTTLNLGSFNLSTGTHELDVWLSDPNATTDQFTNNDTIESFLHVNNQIITAPFTQNFSSNTFPPAGWNVWNPNQNTTWAKSTVSGFDAAGSATVQNFDYDGGGQLDDFISPAIDFGGADSAVLSFMVAYGVYDILDVSVWDGLEVYVSSNGGTNYHMIYKNTGNHLKTIPTEQTSEFVAPPSQRNKWRKETLNLSPYLVPGNKLLLKFRNTNAYGNNLYIDDIKMAAFTKNERDAFPVSVLGIADYFCEGNPTPEIVFGSNGITPLNTLKIYFKIDNDSYSTLDYNGTINSGNTDTILLPAFPDLSPGYHTLTVYTSAPNGLQDQYIKNDTILKSFYVFGTVATPLVEDFENINFPPANWIVDNKDGDITWERTNGAAFSGTASMVIRNFDYLQSGTNDKFISSIISGNATYDSLLVTFDLAYGAGENNPSSTTLPLDTLELQTTRDCGQANFSVWKKWGTELVTASSSGTSQTRFIPKSSDWKHVRILLDPVVGSSNFQIYLIAKGNQQNDLYIDNINIFGKIVPARLKKQGYLVYPNPFTTQILIRNYEEPTNFESAAIYNSLGQCIWKQSFNGNAQKIVTVDSKNFPSGIYTVRLEYTDKVVVQKIVKLR